MALQTRDITEYLRSGEASKLDIKDDNVYSENKFIA